MEKRVGGRWVEGEDMQEERSRRMKTVRIMERRIEGREGGWRERRRRIEDGEE